MSLLDKEPCYWAYKDPFWGAQKIEDASWAERVFSAQSACAERATSVDWPPSRAQVLRGRLGLEEKEEERRKRIARETAFLNVAVHYIDHLNGKHMRGGSAYANNPWARYVLNSALFREEFERVMGRPPTKSPTVRAPKKRFFNDVAYSTTPSFVTFTALYSGTSGS